MKEGISVSPMILRTANYRFMIHSHDHGPAHLHIYGPGTHMKFDLMNFECKEAYGVTAREIRKIQNFIEENQTLFLDAWAEIHDE
jgi:hypothetical protein